MQQLIEITLGIMTSVGGFVDVGEMVFAAQAGSYFGFALIWVFVLGTVAIIIFGEMSGRVAAVAKQPVFNLMRQRLGLELGLVTLIASIAVSIITCAAEIGGSALVLSHLTGWNYALLAIAATLFLVAVIWFLPFKWIERTFGLLGLGMITFAVVASKIDVPWHEAARGLSPTIVFTIPKQHALAFAYFVVAILSAVLFPYELYFYSSGGIEERWSAKDLKINRLTTTVGFALGSLLAISILINAAVLFRPVHIDPQLPATVALQAAMPFGQHGLLFALFGMLFAITGAAIETCLSSAYSLAQFLGWEWGRHLPPRAAPRFTVTWIVTFGLALAIVLTGVPALKMVELSVVFSVVLLPLTYLPLILIAGDRKYMGSHVNGRLTNIAAWTFYALICIAAIAALPLYVLTSGGQV
jgi:manganese transport protein